MPTILSYFGLIGSGLIVAAYFAAQQKWLDQESIAYLLANFFGAVLILASLYVEWNLPSAVIEGFWAIISLRGMFKLYDRRQLENGIQRNNIKSVPREDKSGPNS